MPTRRKTCYPLSNNLAALCLGLAVVLACVGCADDRDLIDQTLDARVKALNALDIDAYLALFSPEYVPVQPGNDYRQEMRQRFEGLQKVEYITFSRTVQIQQDIARVMQEYHITAVSRKNSIRQATGKDHFLLKRHGFGPFKRWLFYQGLDAPAPPAATPKPSTTTAPPPTPSNGG